MCKNLRVPYTPQKKEGIYMADWFVWVVETWYEIIN